VLTEDEKEQARQNIGAQQQLQLTVKDNGNIVLSNLNGQTKEFMPATPSGDPMHWAYVSAGAEYNATNDYILKDAPWKDMVDTIEDKAKWGLDVVDASNVKKMTIGGVVYNYATENRTSPEGGTYDRYFLVGQSNGIWVEDETKVLHLPKCWYLNGLGDITNAEMRRVELAGGMYPYKNYYGSNARTLIPSPLSGQEGGSSLVTVSSVLGFSKVESAFFSTATYLVSTHGVSTSNNAISTLLYKANNMKYLQRISTGGNKNTIDYSSIQKLRALQIKSLLSNVKLNQLQLISKPSIKYTIDKATPSSAITITLHADAYARLAEDADIVAALAAKPLVTLVSA
jgi:hypothetical protein